MTEKEWSKIKQGDILVPNGTSKQSLYWLLKDLKEVEVKSRRSWGNFYGKVIKGKVTAKSLYDISGTEYEPYLDFKHFKLATPKENYQIY